MHLTLLATALAALAAAAVLAFLMLRLDPEPPSTANLGAVEILLTGGVIGVAIIAVIGLYSWLATRRAVRDLVEAVRLQRASVENVRHELRTPLAVLDARLQSLQRHLTVGDPAASAVEHLRVDTAVLTHIVGDMLETANQPATRSDLPTSVAPVLRLAVESMRLIATDRSITIDYTSEPQLACWMPSGDLHRCLIALLDNAIRFSPDGSTVTVVSEADSGSVLIAVRDEGPGISGIAVDAVFRRFARGTGGVPRSGGAGLGLALVQDAARRVGGSVELTATGPEGTRFLLRLPASEPSAGEIAQP